MLKELCGNRRSDSAIRSTARLTWRAYLAAAGSMRLVLYWILVPASGVEPPRPCGHEILSLARMPISPRRDGPNFRSRPLLAAAPDRRD